MSDPSDNWVSKATRHPSRGGLRRILCASLEEADSFVKSGCHHRAIRSPQSGPRLNNKSGRSVGNWVHSVRSIRYCLPRVRLSIHSPLLPLSFLSPPFLSLSLSPDSSRTLISPSPLSSRTESPPKPRKTLGCRLEEFQPAVTAPYSRLFNYFYWPGHYSGGRRERKIGGRFHCGD